MNENDIKAGQDAAIARLERACMAGGWIAAQIESDDVAEALRYITHLKAERDAALADLEWVVSNSGIRIQGRGDSWSALDFRNGLTFIVRDVPTMRDAIAAARSKMDGVKP